MDEIIERCLQHKLSFYGYFILHCLYNEDGNTITNYCHNVGKINTKDFLNLASEGWIEPLRDEKEILIEDLIITDRFKTEVLKIPVIKNLTFEQAFDQLREHYPTKAGVTERRLHSDIDRCKVLYRNAIVKNGVVNLELHSKILQCIAYELKLKARDRSLNYLLMLPTWLQQKTWNLYLSEIESLAKRGNSSTTSDSNEGNIDAI